MSPPVASLAQVLLNSSHLSGRPFEPTEPFPLPRRELSVGYGSSPGPRWGPGPCNRALRS